LRGSLQHESKKVKQLIICHSKQVEANEKWILKTREIDFGE